MKCPICKRGELNEFSAGVWCSRRYAKRAPCGFEAGLCNSPQEWTAQVERYRSRQQELAAQVMRRVSSPP